MSKDLKQILLASGDQVEIKVGDNTYKAHITLIEQVKIEEIKEKETIEVPKGIFFAYGNGTNVRLMFNDGKNEIRYTQDNSTFLISNTLAGDILCTQSQRFVLKPVAKEDLKVGDWFYACDDVAEMEAGQIHWYNLLLANNKAAGLCEGAIQFNMNFERFDNSKHFYRVELAQ